MAKDISAPEFEQLYAATARDVFAFVRRRTAGDAEDLVAETYAIAWRRRSELPPPLLRRAWLFGVARRLLLADYRKQARENELRNDITVMEDGIAVSDEDPRARIMSEALGRLSDADREILRLTSWENLTSSEVAVVLRIRPGAARVRLHRARRALASDPAVRRLVADSEPEPRTHHPSAPATAT